MNITDEGFILVEITPEMIATATTKATDLGICRNSIRGGGGNVVGFLGEEIVLHAFGGAATSNNTYQHDISFDDDTFEVKSKDRTVFPTLRYEASVAQFNTKQQADFYIFTSIFRNKLTNQYTYGYVTGMIEKKKYFQIAKHWAVGDYDPDNDWTCKAACWNVPYAQLTRFESWR